MAVGVEKPEVPAGFFHSVTAWAKAEPENPPLNTFLTFITLSWESIINDLLWKNS